MRKKLNLALIGAGRIGKLHAETVAFRIPEATLAAITDVQRDAAEAVARRCTIPCVVAGTNEILQDSDIDAVLVCSPTNTHADLVIEAARAGKHVFCEKPIDHTIEKVDHVLSEVKKAGVKLQVGYNRRFDPNFARVRRSIVSGEIGTPHLIHIISRDPSPPPISYIKNSGGMFLDMTTHDFDMARFLIGDEVEQVYAAAGVRVDPQIGEAGDVDTAVIVLHFANGVIGTIDNCRSAPYGYDQRVEVLGSKGSIATENCYPNYAVISTAESVRRDLPLNFFLDRYAESFEHELKAFTEAILKDTPTPVTGTDGRAPVVIGLAARKSYDERRPVSIQEISAPEGTARTARS